MIDTPKKTRETMRRRTPSQSAPAPQDANPAPPEREDLAPWIIANEFKFWSMCSDRRCRRAKTCSGNARACFDRYWPSVPEDLKVWFRATILAGKRGLTPEEAYLEGAKAMARMNEPFPGDLVQPAAAANAAAEAASPAGPRIRRL